MTVFDAAKTQAIDVFVRVGHVTLRDAWATLEALIAARVEVPCATCGETGFTGYHRAMDRGSWVDDIPTKCEPCRGSGTVPGGPLILLAPEQVGWQWLDDGIADGGLARLGPNIPGGDTRWHPVFVAREST